MTKKRKTATKRKPRPIDAKAFIMGQKTEARLRVTFDLSPERLEYGDQTPDDALRVQLHDLISAAIADYRLSLASLNIQLFPDGVKVELEQ